MSVDLSGFTAQVQVAVSPPGSNLFADANDNDWLEALIGGFWDARLDGFMIEWTENADGMSPGIITPVSPGTKDLPRQLVQLVIFYTALNAIRGLMTNVKTQFKAQAGSVSVEQQQSANILRDVFEDLTARRAELYRVLSEQGFVRIGYLDGFRERNTSIRFGETWWLR